MGGLSGKHFRLCNSVSFVAVLVKGLQSQSGCARLVIILCGFGSFSVIVFCFVFLFMYFSFSSELLFNSIGYGSLPACLPAWLFPLPACMTVSTACLPALDPSACYLTWLLPLGSLHSSLSLAPPCVLALWPTAGSIVPPVSAGKSLTPSRPGSQLKNSVRGTPVAGEAEHEELPPREPTPVPSMSIYMQAVEWLLEVKAIPVSVVLSC